MRRLRSLPWHHHPAHPHVVVPVRIDPTGLRGPTAQVVRGKQWRRLGGGWFAPPGADPELVDQRIVEAAVAMPEHAGVTGWADLRWRGAHWFDGLAGDRSVRRVPLVIAGSNLRATPTMLPSKERLAPDQIEVVDGLRVTLAVRSVLYEMRYAASVRAAVRVFDMAAYDDLVSLAEVEDHVLTHLSGWTGVPQVRTALGLVDENAWSPTEVDLRMVWTLDAGLPHPLCNRPIFGLDGTHLGTPDVFDPETGLAGEYDGAHHLSARRHVLDLDRVSDFAAHGIVVVTMAATDRGDPGRFLDRLAVARRRAALLAAAPRTWTVEPPAWWWATDTVEARRALPPEKRHLLDHRRRP